MVTTDDLAALRDRLAGAVTEPGDPGWDDARRAWNLAVDQRPALVAEPAGADDVAAVVEFARERGLGVAPQATGHAAAALGSLDGAVLLKTSRMRGVAVDPATRVARVDAGATAGEVADAAGAHGLAPVAGFASSVGVVGLTLGGGLGWLGRTHGLACNNVRAIELVTAAGEQKRVDGDNDPDLFWALRGGGGSFAVVTALELELHPVAEAFAGAVFWPAEEAAEVLEHYRRFALDVPETLTSVFRFLSLPDIPPLPPPIRGRRVVAIMAAHLGSEHDGARLLRPLRGAGTALLDTFAPVPAPALVRVTGDPEDPVPAFGDGLLLAELSSELVDALAERIVADRLAPLVAFELRHLGGALARAPQGHGALPRLDGAFSAFATGPAPDADTRALVEARIGELQELLRPWTAPQTLLNFRESGADPASAFSDDAWRNLRRTRSEAEPDGLLVACHPVPTE